METVDESDLQSEATERGDVSFERIQLGEAAGSEALGCSLHVVPPGKRAWPYHYHTANEEAMYVLAGEGTVRGPDDERVHVEPGTYAAFPAGPAGAHQVENDGDEPLRYLAISTMIEPEVLVYPDSGKIGVMAGEPPGGDEDERLVSAYYRREDDVDYWEGEG